MKGTMKKTMKKIVSVVLAMAMLVTSISYTPSTVDAADYSTMEFTEATGSVGTYKYAYNIVTNTIVGWNRSIEFYGDGVGMKLAYSADNKTEDTKVTINGVDKTVSDPEVHEIALGMISFNPSVFEDNAYTDIVITTTTGSANIVFRKGNPEAETSTGGEEGESPTAPAGATWTAWGTSTDYSYYVASGHINSTDFQSDGLYVALQSRPTSIKLNGVTVTNMMADGAHAKIALDKVANDGIYKLYLANDAGEIATVYIKKGNAGETSSETPTETSTEEPQLQWKTDANLTAALGEGTRYAVVGELPGGNYTINADNINITTGAFGSKLVVTLNDTELWNGSYAMGLSIPYTKMISGMNTIKADGVHTTDGNVSMTIYVDVPAKPLNLYVNNYVSATGKYIVKFDSVENAVSYKVYIDGAATDISLGGSGDYIDYSELSSVTEGDHKLALSAVYADGTETSKSGEVSFNKPASAGENTEIPQIYIQTDDKAIQPLSIQKSQGNLNSSITVVDNKGGQFADIFEDGAKTTIKVRGNSTADADKKAFNIKFTDKQNVFNFGSAKKWSLLANAFDKSLIRNKLAMDLGIDAGVPYNSKSRYIDLYLNGRYMGNYLLIESVEVGTSRVDIGSEATDVYNNDILVELENNGKVEEGVTYFTTTTYNQRFVIGSPETVGDSTQEFFDQKLANVQTVFNKFETDLNANDYAAYSQYIDVDSFVNFYLIAELFKCQDIAFSSTRFFIKDNKIYAGPLWDYDLSSGNVSTSYYSAENQSAQNYLAKNMKWFGALMENDAFKEKVVARYYELLPRIKAIYEGDNSEINKIVAEIQNSATRNYTSVEQGGAGWSATDKDSADGYSYANDKVYTSFNNDGDATSSVALFKKWMADRVEFLSSEWHDASSITTEDMIGSTLYNLALRKDLTVYKRINDGALENINNGNVTLNNGTSADFGAIVPTDEGWGDQNDPVYMTVDLGDYYDASTLDKIIIQYKDKNENDTVIGRSYIIQYSTDGSYFRDVKAEQSVTELDESNRTTDGVSDVTGAVRYVRVYYPKDSTYGIQVAEFAVLDTNKNATTIAQEIISAPTGVTAVQSEESERTIKVNIPVVEGQENYKYIIKVDGEVKATNVAAGDTSITGVAIGEHKVSVIATHNGFTSESSEEISVQVTGVKTLEERVADSTINLALGKAANGAMTGYPELGIEGGGVDKITNGLLDTQYAVIGKAGWGYKGEIYGVIDLGAYYDASSIDDILIQYRNNADNTGVLNKAYKVQYSTDNEYYYDAVTSKTVTAYEGGIPRTIDDVSNVTGVVRYVKVYWPVSPDYGAQLSEIAVLADNAKTVEEQTVTAPTFTAVVPEGTYNTVSVTVGGSEDTATYAVLIDGVVALKGVAAGTYEITGVKAGEHTVTAVAINNEFSKTAEGKTVTVEDGFTLNVTGAAALAVFPESKDGLHNHVIGHDGVAGSASEGNYRDAIDQNIGTRWGTGQSDPQYLTIDLGAVRKIKEVDLHWETASAKDYTIDISDDGNTWKTVAFITGGIEQENRLDSITLTNEAQARYVRMNGTARATNYGYSIWEMAIYGSDDEVVTTTAEETTTAGGIAPTTEPAGAEWTLFSTSNTYSYYVPAGNEGAFKIADKQFIQQPEGLYFGMNIIPSNIKVNGVSVENLMDSGAQMRLSYDNFEQNGAYQITFTGSDTKEYTVWVKKDTPKDYKPTGVLATADAAAKTATVTWTPSADAETAGCTYTVQVANLDPVTVLGAEATVDITSLAFGNYEVTVNAVLDGKVVGTTKETLKYKDPEAVDSTLNIVYNWEKFRQEELSWTKVENAVGYAIYTDGKLFKTVGADVLGYNVPAWAFADTTNSNGQPTPVGKEHNTAVVALLEGDTAADNLVDVNTKRIIGKEPFNLYVNYVYGNGTDLWNNTGVDSPWNFTICEAPVEGSITEGADVKVSYDTDGAANLTINSVGKHAGKDQQWTIKTAIYDEEIGKGNFINLAFDIKGPACLVGEKIMIKCIAEEIQADGQYAGNPYEEVYYTFEEETDANGEKYAVIHYSNSFESTNDTYDLLFGLGLLDPTTINGGDPINLSLSDTTVTKVYGLTSLTPSPVVNKDDINNSSIFVSWQTDVPSHLQNEYSYNVYIDDKLATLPADQSVYKNNLTYAGYAPGTHKVKVESIYNGAITSTKEAEVTIEDMDKPDLVVTGIEIPEGEHHIGDKIPVYVTVKNIGTAKVVGDGNKHLTVRAFVGEKDLGYKWVYDGNAEKAHTLDVGESYTVEYEYTIADAEDKGGYLYDFSAIVDSDKNFTTVESNPDNNTYKQTFKFFAKITPVALTNEGDHIKADWDDHDSTNEKFILTYTVEGETEPRTIETTGNISEIDLPKDVWLAYGSEVKVTAVHTDGSSHHFAESKAYPDLVISKVDIPREAYAVDDKVPITVTMKNIGVATALPNDNGNMTLKPSRNGSLITEGAKVNPTYRTMAEDGLEQKLKVGEEFTHTFNYTVQQEDLNAGTINLGGHADGDYKVTETIDDSDAGTGNNVSELPIKIMEKGTLTLDSNNGEGPVTATWTAADLSRVKGYKLKYTIDGKTYKEVAIDPISDPNVVYNADANTYTYKFPDAEGIFNQTDVTVMITFDEDTANGTYYDFASDTAEVDLTITKVELVREDNTVLAEAFTVKTYEKFYVKSYIKNIGTACVKPCTSDDGNTQEAEGINITARDDANNVLKGEGRTAKVIYTGGLTVGQSATVDVGIIQLEKQGVQNINVTVDDVAWNFTGNVGGIGYIQESDETNNRKDLEMNVIFEQKPMDWTPLYVENDKDKTPYEFKVANNTQKAHIEYKVLDTSFTDMDYIDIFESYVGYNTEWYSMSMGALDDEHKIFNAIDVETGETDPNTGKPIMETKFYTITEFAQVTKELCDNYNDYKGTEKDAHYTMISTTADIIDFETGEVLVAKDSDGAAGSRMIYNGQGWNYYANSYAPGKHYIYKIRNQENGQYVTVALRVTGEYGEWTKAMPTDDTNPDKLSFYYHGENCQFNDANGVVCREGAQAYPTTGAFYYNGSDLGLATITCYNGGYLTLVPDATMPMGAQGQWKIQIARASVDENGKYVKPTQEITDENSVVITRKPNVFNIQGDRLLLKLPELMQELPVHSEKGGQKDANYYFMKVYTDTEKRPDKYIEIPVMIVADIPMIENLTDTNVFTRLRRDDLEDKSILSLSWDETSNQEPYDYHYDVEVSNAVLNETTGEYEAGKLIAKEIDASPSAGHIYDVSEYAKDENSKIFVKITTSWCGQSVAYTRVVDNKYNKGWRHIGGDPLIDVHAGQENKVSVLGTFSFYDDVAENHTYLVTGYNGMYISIDGNTNYIGGNPDAPETLSKLYISEGVPSVEQLDTMTDEQYSDLSNKVYLQADGKMQVNTQDQFEVTYQTTYYNVKIVKGDKVSVIKMKVEVDPGDVEIKAFQMNTNTSAGAVSEFNPSFRTVSRASKVVALPESVPGVDEAGNAIENHKIASVQSYGTMYTVNEDATTDNMKFGDSYVANGEFANGIYSFEATKENGTLTNWPNAEDKNSFYYALTFKSKTYLLDMLDKEYKLRAYAVTENGDIVYGNDVVTTSIYSIAEVLYNNQLMSKKSSHDFLYDNVLNIVSIKNNKDYIVNAVFKALKITNTQDPNYAYARNMYQDLYRYITFTGVYHSDRYSERGKFVCKTLTNGENTEEKLLELLNTSTTDNKKYTTVAEWIENETDNYYQGKGFYQRVEFGNTGGVVGA